MKQLSLRAVCAAAGLAALGLPLAAHAESALQTGAGVLTATARLDFRVTIPRVLFLQVGTGTTMAANAAVNLIDFVVPAASLGNGVPIAATVASGDLGSGAVTARVQANAGAVTLTSTTLGALSNGVDTLTFSQIGTVATANTTVAVLAAPALADGATTSTTVPAVASIVNRDARWTFSFLNAAFVPPGTYGGVGTNNGRVTYTASMP
jgi:hypothetical protein